MNIAVSSSTSDVRAKRQRIAPPLIVAGLHGTTWMTGIETQLHCDETFEMVLIKLSKREVSGEYRKSSVLCSGIITPIPTDDVFETIYAMDEWQPTGSESWSQWQTVQDKIAILNPAQRPLQCQRIVDEFKNAQTGQHTQCSQFLNSCMTTILGTEYTGNEDPPPPLTLINGPPGVGKKKIQDALKKICHISGRCYLVVTPEDCSEFKLDDEGEQSFSSFFRKLRDIDFDRETIILVDRTEAISAWHLGRVSWMCRKYTTAYEDFGGCTVFLFGDLRQPVAIEGPDIISCVIDRTLPECITCRCYCRSCGSYDDGELDYVFHGTDIMTEVAYCELTEQWHCNDQVHAGLIKKMCSSEPIRPDCLRNAGYSLLKPLDTTRTEWMRAPVLVPEIGASCRVTLQRARMFALHTNQPVLRWLCDFDLGSWMNRPLEQHRMDALRDPCFYQMFVRGADGYMSADYNRRLGLVCGTKIRYVSLLFADEHLDELQGHLRRARAGDVVTLPFSPLVVIVEVFPPDWLDREARRGLCSVSLEKDGQRRLVVPIDLRPSAWSFRAPVRGGKGYGPSQVSVKPLFPLELAFAMTIQQAAGKKLRRVILAPTDGLYNRCSLSYRELYSGLSHAIRRSNIKLLLAGDSEEQQWETLSSIGQLNPDQATEYYFLGFTCNDPSEELDRTAAEWDYKRASEWYQRQRHLYD